MIIEYDFGKKERPGAKRPVKSASAQSTNEVRHFGKAQVHLELANARIAKLESALRSAHAMGTAGQDGTAQERILVDAAEYARLLRCRELVAAALVDG